MSKRTVSLTIDGDLWDAYGTYTKNKSEGVEALIRNAITATMKENPKLAEIKQQIELLERSAVDVAEQAKRDQITTLKAECLKFMVFYEDGKVRWDCSTEKQNELLIKASVLGINLTKLLADEMANGKARHIGVKWEELYSTRSQGLIATAMGKEGIITAVTGKEGEGMASLAMSTAKDIAKELGETGEDKDGGSAQAV